MASGRRVGPMSRALLVALLMVTVTLAGCTEDDTPPPQIDDPGPVQTTTTSSAPPEPEQPGNITEVPFEGLEEDDEWVCDVGAKGKHPATRNVIWVDEDKIVHGGPNNGTKLKTPMMGTDEPDTIYVPDLEYKAWGKKTTGYRSQEAWLTEVFGGGGDDRICISQSRDSGHFEVQPLGTPTLVDRLTVWAGDGADRIWVLTGADRIRVYGEAGTDRFVGGPGDDSMFGDGHDDFLDGQDGTDSADGGVATDTCIAETLLNCEI